MHKMMMFVLLAILSSSCMKDSGNKESQKAIDLQASSGCGDKTEKQSEDVVSRKQSSSKLEESDEFSFDEKKENDSGCTL